MLTLHQPVRDLGVLYMSVFWHCEWSCPWCLSFMQTRIRNECWPTIKWNEGTRIKSRVVGAQWFYLHLLCVQIWEDRKHILGVAVPTRGLWFLTFGSQMPTCGLLGPLWHTKCALRCGGLDGLWPLCLGYWWTFEGVLRITLSCYLLADFSACAEYAHDKIRPPMICITL